MRSTISELKGKARTWIIKEKKRDDLLRHNKKNTDQITTTFSTEGKTGK